jgi:hypothetical protein
MAAGEGPETIAVALLEQHPSPRENYRTGPQLNVGHAADLLVSRRRIATDDCAF